MVFLGTFTLRITTEYIHHLCVELITSLAQILMMDVVRCIHTQRRGLAEDEGRIDRKEFLPSFSQMPKAKVRPDTGQDISLVKLDHYKLGPRVLK